MADTKTASTLNPARWQRAWRPRDLMRLFLSLKDRAPIDARANARLIHAEQQGLKLAMLCRTGALAIFGTFYVVSLYLSNSSPSLAGLCLLVILISMGVGHYLVIGTRYDTTWLKFFTLGLDILVVCALLAFVPISSAQGVPQIMVFRSFGIQILFPFLALATLSFSPRLVLWIGFLGVVGWWALYAIVVWPMETTLSWTEIPPDADRAIYEAVVLSPDFVGRGTRMVETLTMFVTALILAFAVARARQLFLAHLRAEAAREAERAARERITQQLGRFVPTTVVTRLIDDPSGLVPQVRRGAVLVMDIQDFTVYAEHRDPKEVIADLNTFLAECADRVSAFAGVVISFTGDGLLATFNTPLEVEAPELAALTAARRLAEVAEEYGFVVRVGLAAGPIAAGSVGSTNRQAFTVYGTTVNRAARLETLAKTLGTKILADAAICEAAPEGMEPLGSHRVQGFSDPVAVFGLRVEAAS
ncbi:MAG: adenylate/guanylate cyclase domain-containing protein [Pseudomonadota bacterium]